jgi:hypothetical protein
MISVERARALLAYDPDTGLFVWRQKSHPNSHMKVGDRAGSTSSATGYASIKIDGVLYPAHRLAWLLAHGRWPAEHIDHINGCADDNRLSNLREATRSQNRQNAKRQSNNLLGAKGVRWHRQGRCYEARIRVDGKLKYLGLFETVDEAAEAYAKAATEAFGEFARPDTEAPHHGR